MLRGGSVKQNVVRLFARDRLHIQLRRNSSHLHHYFVIIMLEDCFLLTGRSILKRTSIV